MDWNDIKKEVDAIKIKTNEIGQKTTDIIKAMQDEMKQAQQRIEKMMPYLAEALQKEKAAGEVSEETTILDLLENIEPTGEIIDPSIENLLEPTVKEMREVLNKTKLIDIIKQASENMDKKTPITQPRINKIKWPKDPLNRELYRLPFRVLPPAVAEITEALEAGKNPRNKYLPATKDNAVKNIKCVLSVPAGLELSRPVDTFGKLICCAIASIMEAGGVVVTATQICKLLYLSENAQNICKIHSYMKRLEAVNYVIDTDQEEQKHPGYKRIKIKGRLLNYIEGSAEINGKKTEFAYYMLTEPALISFARMHNNQLTEIPRELLALPGKAGRGRHISENQLKIMDYVITHISTLTYQAAQFGAKGPKKLNPKILYKTMLKECGLEKTHDKQREIDTMTGILDYYKAVIIPETGRPWIKDYKEVADGVVVETW